MKFIRINNLRSLKDTQKINIKPITILVGKNSSGKSTFLRTFPLLKQSVETPTNSPLLWYGRYVDFGSIEDALNRSSTTKRITLDFGIELIPPNKQQLFREEPEPPPLPVTISLTLGHADAMGEARIISCRLDFGDIDVDLNFNADNRISHFRIGEFDVPRKGSALALRPSAYILPSIYEYKDHLPSRRQIVFRPYFPEQSDQAKEYYGLFFLRQPICVEAFESFLVESDFKKDKINVYDLLMNVPYGNASWMTEQLRAYVSNRKILQGTALSSIKSPSWFKAFRERVFAASMPWILEQADQHIAEFATSVGYMGPLRATAQRYYRVQDLAVREVDFQGENLAMFLRSLSDSDRRRFASFSQQYFDFEVEPKAMGGHVEILLREGKAPMAINLADMGFGYSQVLPVIAKLWSNSPKKQPDRGNRKKIRRLLAIEQPELHLHPAYQSRLADMFAGVVGSVDVDLVIETHSESIINRFGELINNGKLNSDNIQILVFSKEPSGSDSKLSMASFHENGELKDWPYGFFSSDSNKE